MRRIAVHVHCLCTFFYFVTYLASTEQINKSLIWFHCCSCKVVMCERKFTCQKTLISRVKSISTDFYSLFYCCFVTPLSQVRGRVEISLTGLTPPHTLCACPKPGTCSPVDVFVCLFIVIRFTLSQ